MAHQLLDDTMFYVGETPWHKLGVPLDNPPTIEEAVILANLDWEVYKKPTYYFKGKKPVKLYDHQYTLANFANMLYGKSMVETDHYVTIKEDNEGKCIVLGNVSERYEVLQNTDAFTPFNVLLDHGYELETAGAVREGRMVWILARKVDNELNKIGDDLVERYVVLMNSHDGSTPMFMQPTTIRVVCANTLDYALSKESPLRFSIKHTTNVKERLEEVTSALSFAEGNWRKAHEIMNRMVEHEMNFQQVKLYFEAVIPFLKHRGMSGKDELGVARRDIATPVFSQLMNNFAGGHGNKGETVWDAYNAITQYYDHQKNYKDWVWSTQFGKPAQYKRRAFLYATKIVDNTSETFAAA